MVRIYLHRIPGKTNELTFIGLCLNDNVHNSIDMLKLGLLLII